MQIPRHPKQLSLFVSHEDWEVVRWEAARRGLPMAELCRQWLLPKVVEARNAASTSTSLASGQM